MNHTAAARPHWKTLLRRLGATWYRCQSRTVWARIQRELAPQEMDALLGNLGLDRSDLPRVAAADSAKDLLPQLMARHGLSLATVPAQRAEELSDVCAGCSAKIACRAALRAGREVPFCPNTSAFAELRDAGFATAA